MIYYETIMPTYETCKALTLMSNSYIYWAFVVAELMLKVDYSKIEVKKYQNGASKK